MLFNDIPIFYTETDSDSLFDSYVNEYKDYFDKTGYQKILDKITRINYKVIEMQKDVLIMHLGLYDGYKKI